MTDFKLQRRGGGRAEKISQQVTEKQLRNSLKEVVLKKIKTTTTRRWD